MNMKITETCYNDIANTLYNMIPEEWDKVVLYFEHVNNSSEIYFYYYPVKSNKPIYWLDINPNFINDKGFKDQVKQLNDLFREIFNDFVFQKQEPWTSLTYIIESRKLKVSYSYEDISNMSHEEIEARWLTQNKIV